MNNDFEQKKCLFYISNILTHTKYVRKNMKNIADWIIEDGGKYCSYNLFPEVEDADVSDFMKFAKKHKLQAVNRIKEFAEKLRKKTIINKKTTPSILEKNLQYLQILFRLSDKEKDFLGFMLRYDCDAYLKDIAHELHVRCRDLTIEELALISGISLNDIYELCAKNAYLLNLGMLEFEYDGSIETTKFAKFFYMHKFNTLDDIKKHILGIPLTPTLQWVDFSHIEQIEVVKKILASTLKHQEKGINILLYGEPGTGKTEFAKTLAQSVSADIYSIGESANSVLEEDNDESRYKQLLRANILLKNDTNTCLLVDEADDVLYDSQGHSFYNSDRNATKLKVNRMLEQNNKPTIWISNNIRIMDKAYLRRFTYTINFVKPDNKVVQKMWQKSLKENDLPCDEKTAEQFAKKYSLSPSFISTATKSAKLIGGGIVEVEQTLNALQEAYNNGKKNKLAIEKTQTLFNPSLLHTDTNLETLTERIIHLNKLNFSLCLYGVSGTGKSAYAQYLAEKLQIPVIKKKCSDILSMWVGGTEANIASAFEEAKQCGALLIFDEADSFLQDRTGASKSWEVTGVNEMLTQMESHKYPFVCTTNLMNKLDKASLRRFTFKVKYDYMTDYQRTLCFEHFFGIKEVLLDHLNTLTPGDFVVVKNKAEILGCLNDEKELIHLLEQEQLNKAPISNKIGFI